MKLIYGHFKIGIYIDKFKNIELFKQGIYQLRMSLTYEDQEIQGSPDQMWLMGKQKRDWVKVDPGCVMPAHVLEDNKTFCSRSLLIRFQEETLEINELCVFHITVPIIEGRVGNFKLLTELMFTNMEKTKPKEPKLRLLESSPIFECVNQNTYVISNPLQPKVQYLPISFDPDHFCIYESFISVTFEAYNHLDVNKISSLFSGKPLIGAFEINKIFYSLVDPLRLAYDYLGNCIDSFIAETGRKNLAVLSVKDLPVSEQTFYDRIRSHHISVVSQSIIEDVQNVSAEINEVFNNMMQIVTVDSTGVINYLKKLYNQRVTKRFQEFIWIDVKDEEKISKVKQNSEDFVLRAEEVWNSPYYNNLEYIPIQVQDLYNEMPLQPIFFIEAYKEHPSILTVQNANEDSSVCKILDIHLLVIVHGYKGTAMDMHLLKAYLSNIYPKLYILSAKKNERVTDSNISVLGQQLAEEVIHYVSTAKIPQYRLKLSFMCHSMGGLVIRAALPHLKVFRESMYSFISLSSPHLGIQYGNNLLFNIGKNVIRKFANSESLDQMTFGDSSNIYESYIYNLSKFEGLNWFEHLVLFTCSDDPYVNEDSAGVFVPQKAVGTNHEQPLNEMVDNILTGIEPHKFKRVDVHFRKRDIVPGCICMGNRHIDFLDNPYFIKMLCYSFPGLFS